MVALNNRRRLLLIDDDRDFRAVVKPHLEARGFEVVEAKNGAEATEAVQAGGFALILVDGLLPDTNGIAWIEKLRGRGDKTPVVFVSAFWRDFKSFQQLTGALGVALVTHKPVKPEILATQVYQLLGPGDVGGEEPAVDLELELEQIPPALTTPSPYLRALPEKVTALTDALAKSRRGHGDVALLAAARALVHQLHGTAGSYGAAQVSEIAGTIETLLITTSAAAAPATWVDIQLALDDLADAARAAAAGADDALRLVQPPSCRVLVVDDDPEFCRGLQELGRQHMIDVAVAKGGDEALKRIREARPDCAFINVGLAEGSGRVALALREVPGCENLPLAFTSEDSRTQNRVAAAHAGASLYLVKPVDSGAFHSAVRQLLATTMLRRQRVLIVDDDVDFANRVAAVLTAQGITTTHLGDPLRILEVLEEVEPDMVLLDSIMPGISGLDICRMLRTTPRWQDLPILFVTVQTGMEVRLAAFQAGADDYLAKPVVEPELLARVRVRLERARMLRERISTDALTGLLLRRAFLDAAGGRVAEAKRYKRPLTMAVIDLDHFKQVNDHHGHIAGDQVLSTLGRLLMSRLRAEDLRCRWGGEEFALLFAGQATETIVPVLDRLRAELGRLEFRGRNGETFHASFSVGVATSPVDGSNLEALLAVADRRLYAAKHAGRDRVLAAG